MYDVCCVLFVVWRLLCVACSWLFVGGCVLFVACSLLCVICALLFAV